MFLVGYQPVKCCFCRLSFSNIVSCRLSICKIVSLKLSASEMLFLKAVSQ